MSTERAQEQTDPHAHRIISADEQQRAFRSARRHSQRVNILKWGLPVFAIALMIGFVGWVIDNQPAPVEAPVEEAAAILQKDELVMQNPKLNGFAEGRAYEVLAERAIQKVATPDIVDLEQLQARITDEQERWAHVTASKGHFNQTEETLALDGDVQVTSSLGYGLGTEEVEIEMKKGYMRTLSPVSIQSKDILLSADQLEAIDNGEHFRFTGRVTLNIDPAMMDKKAGTPTTEAQP
jgi:lipopolysaccharide export system protein LptC